jgi:hypothetical protein
MLSACQVVGRLTCRLKSAVRRLFHLSGPKDTRVAHTCTLLASLTRSEALIIQFPLPIDGKN